MEQNELMEAIVVGHSVMKKTTDDMGNNVIFYEYSLNGDVVDEHEYRGYQRKDGSLLVYMYRNNKQVGNRRFIHQRDFEQISRNRLCTIDQDFDKYSKILIENYEEQVETTRKLLAEQERRLEALKANAQKKRQS